MEYDQVILLLLGYKRKRNVTNWYYDIYTLYVG
jgi:hypothetical protein